jgi:hypothetical protein
MDLLALLVGLVSFASRTCCLLVGLVSFDGRTSRCSFETLLRIVRVVIVDCLQYIVDCQSLPVKARCPEGN